MGFIFHLAEAEAWDPAASEYSAASLATEGFIHCSNEAQLAGVVDRYYAGRSGLVLLTIDARKVTGLVYEDLHDAGEVFPHVYGPIPMSAIVHAAPFEP